MSSNLYPRAETHGSEAETFVYRPAQSAQRSAVEERLPAPEAAAEAALRAEMARREQDAWSKGFQEGQERLRADDEKRIEDAREAVANCVRDFARERQSYFDRVEEEVVRLALAIARKILKREAQMDPLLLNGLVHVALEKVGSSSKVRVRAHPSQLASWKEHFHQTPGRQQNAELVADDSLAPEQCVLETEMGSTEVSLEGHLKEIEQGFFDLLAQRPTGS